MLVGSSLGGYVAVASASLLHARGVFLMAPALYLEGLPELRAGVLDCPAVVVHGWRDEVVPYEHSVRFAHANKAALHLLESDHRLHNQLRVIQYLFEYFLIALDLPRDRLRVKPSAPFADGARGDASTSRGTSSRAQRPKRPRAEVIRSRWRRCMARTMSCAHCSAVMMRASCIGRRARAAVPSGPSGAAVNLAHHEVRRDEGHVDAAAAQLDAQRIEEADQRVLAGGITGAFGHAGEPGDARDRDDQAARGPSGAAARAP